MYKIVIKSYGATTLNFMDEKIFDKWNEEKKKINFHNSCPHFLPGQIWWAQMGQNIATEIAGKGDDFLRPIVIMQRVYGNACLAIPLTKTERQGNYYFCFQDSKGRTQYALLTQIRYLDGKRLKYQRANIKKEDLDNLRKYFYKLINKITPT